jgi:ADP-heptose:LPS heptosyltransferase
LNAKTKKLLVIRLSAMGDVAMTVPVLKAVLAQNKNVEITVLTRAFFAPTFKELSNVSVIIADVNNKHKGFKGLYRLYKTLKQEDFFAIADLHNVLRTTILKLFFFGKKYYQINKGRAEKKELISGKNRIQLKTTHQRYADVFEKIGLSADVSNPTFFKRQTLPKEVNSFLKNKSNKKLIGIAPFAAHKGKMYPLEKMKIVIEKLSKNYAILLFGGKNDANQLKELELNSDIFSIAGKISFEEELNTISNLDLMLSMDSGNAHLAANYGVKVITVWGVTHPFAGFAPFYQPKDFSLLPDLTKFPKVPTSIYGNSYPEGYEDAAGSILPETILEKVEMILNH